MDSEAREPIATPNPVLALNFPTRSIEATVQGVQAQAKQLELWGKRLAVLEETVKTKERLGDYARVAKQQDAARLEDE